MKFTALKSYAYYPDINGNLDLPEGERLSVEIIRPTAEDYGTLLSLEIAQKNHKDDADRSVFRYNVPRILQRHVGEIKNLTVGDADNPGKEKPVTSGKELAQASFAGMFPLVNAICTEVCAERMPDTQKKISEPGSASSGADGTTGN
jgi:CO dehydrogenase/acetyl-CoA synthase delta subunit